MNPDRDLPFNLRAAFPEKEERDTFFNAVDKNDLAAVEKLLDKKPEAVNWTKFGGIDASKTAFLIAARHDKTDMMDLLLRHGADIDATDSLGMTALHVAAFRGNAGHAEFLLRRGATVDLPNQHYKETALMLAVQQDQWACTDLLIICGADMHRKEWRDRSAVDIAWQAGNTELLKVMAEAQERLSISKFLRAHPDTRTDTGEAIKPMKPIGLKPKP